MKLGWILLTVAVAGGVYYYLHQHQAVTRLQPNTKYTLKGPAPQLIAAVTSLFGASSVNSIASDSTGAASVTLTYTGPGASVPAGVTATPA